MADSGNPPLSGGTNRAQKRKFDSCDKEPVAPPVKKSLEMGQVIAKHYNETHGEDVTKRHESRIIYLRGFHNWIKGSLIRQYLHVIRDSKKYHTDPVNALDLCCGQGGDLFKWCQGGIKHLICTDIAEQSLEKCRVRYDSLAARRRNSIFSVEYVTADVTKTFLRPKYKDVTIRLDLVSCQFALHYGFESLTQAKCLLRNAADCLRVGGYFIGTIPDANQLVARFRKFNGEFGNDVYQVKPHFNYNSPKIPLFGAKYDFQLDTVVNCPEFLVHFPTLVRIAEQYGLELVSKMNFKQYFQRRWKEDIDLMHKTNALESFPPTKGDTLMGPDEEYTHAKQFLDSDPDVGNIGTLSKSEWEVSSLYLLFVFKKIAVDFQV